ncbi:MAG: amidohydrolase family protein [Hyphomicrobiales bacterium]|nr:amidohydrolase family protein [Hyphomicrobiales bacterium]
MSHSADITKAIPGVAGLMSSIAVAALLFMPSSVAQEPEQLPQTLFTNVNVWDGTSDGLSENQRVLVEGNLVKTIGDETLEANADATVVDGGGRTLMPGLIDMHTHLALLRPIQEVETTWDGFALGAMASESMRSFLDKGYTTIRDICLGMPGIARAIERGLITGPRYYHGGACLSGTSGHADWDQVNAPKGREGTFERMGLVSINNGPDEYREAVRWNMRNGASVIKLFVGGGVASQFDPLESVTATAEEIRAVVEAAEGFGTYVCVHAFNDKSVNLALDNGVRCVEHGFLMEEATVQRMAEEGQVLSLQAWIGYKSFAKPEEITGFTAESIRKAKDVHANTDKVMGWVKKYGVETFAGTDMYDSTMVPLVAEDLAVRQRWFEDVEILRQNTSNAAKWLAATGPKNPYKEGPLGVVAPGAYADLILVKGDPTQDVSILFDHENNINLVMKDGEIYKNTLN